LALKAPSSVRFEHLGYWKKPFTSLAFTRQRFKRVIALKGHCFWY